jgi:hypothetical protein
MGQDIEVGQGRLSWSPDERRTGRYGMVTLKGLATDRCLEPDPELAGLRGSLVAQVVQAAEADDAAPEEWLAGQGERITLGFGTVVVEPVWYYVAGIGLRPDDGRDENWLDPDALSRAHHQREVRLWFVPEAWAGS